MACDANTVHERDRDAENCLKVFWSVRAYLTCNPEPVYRFLRAPANQHGVSTVIYQDRIHLVNDGVVEWPFDSLQKHSQYFTPFCFCFMILLLLCFPYLGSFCNISLGRNHKLICSYSLCLSSAMLVIVPIRVV